MEFLVRKDIEAPQEAVFHACTDFAVFERQALRQGVEVIRTSGDAPVGPGTGWLIGFEYLNRPWKVDATITTHDPFNGCVIRGVSSGIDVDVSIDLMALSLGVTRLTFTATLIPRSISTRILVQSLRLVRPQIQSRLDRRIGRMASDIEGRARAKS